HDTGLRRATQRLGQRIERQQRDLGCAAALRRGGPQVQLERLARAREAEDEGQGRAALERSDQTPGVEEVHAGPPLPAWSARYRRIASYEVSCSWSCMPIVTPNSPS